ncbi:MAG: coniferyl-alcohol dehydrogenase [Proteobacteria bacterium]|nr:coniferyl-alcohol dehydrogenase [Pseudomonadota bacterium]
MIDNKTVILTGASSGVGKAVAQRLLERGSKVIAIDIKEPSTAVAEYYRCDLGDPLSIDELLNKLTGSYACVLNVAGVPGTVGDETTMRVNLLGLRHFTDSVWDRIEDGGTVVNVASIAGNNWRRRRNFLNDLLATTSFEEGLEWWRTNHTALDTDAYTFSKEAVVLYTMQLAGRGLARGIRVNDVGPGPVDTPILPDFTRATGEELMQQMINIVGRPAQPGDIADAIVVLAQGSIGWLNGQHIVVDGGLTAGYSAGWHKGSSTR